MKNKNPLEEQVADEMPVETQAEMPETPMAEAPEMPTETPETPPMEEEMTAGEPDKLVVVLQKYLPGQEVTEENKSELAVSVIEKLSGIQDNLIEIADEYPEFAMFLNDILKGMPLEEAVARNFDDLMTPPEGAPDWENINKGREVRKASLGEKKAKMETITKNKQVSIENTQKFIEKTGLPEAEAIKYLDWIDKLNTDMFDGLITEAHHEALYKSYTYDSDMAAKDEQLNEVAESARITGRNEQIEKRKINAETGDGIPKLTTSGKAPAPKGKETYASKFVKGLV